MPFVPSYQSMLCFELFILFLFSHINSVSTALTHLLAFYSIAMSGPALMESERMSIALMIHRMCSRLLCIMTRVASDA